MNKIFLILILIISTPAFARDNTICRSWPMNMGKTWLQDNHIVNENQLLSQKTQFRLLSSEEKTKGQYTDVYFFSFFDKKGKQYNLITQSISSDEECSMSEVNFYLVSKYEKNY